MDDALRVASSSFRRAFTEWTLWNYFTGSRADSIYYEEGELYPEVVSTSVWLSFVPRVAPNSLAALSARYHQVLGRPDTLVLALANVHFDAGLQKSTSSFPYAYVLDTVRSQSAYRSTPAGVYVKLEAGDRTNWYDWDIVGSSVSVRSVADGAAFPNPFVADGKRRLFITSTWTLPTRGSVSVFNSSMDLVFSADVISEASLPGKQGFTWDGKTFSGEIAQTGVYFYVIETEGTVIKGKVAVIRR
jgi:hypothetical protein